MNWAIANQATFNIVALNYSAGDTTANPSACPGHQLASGFANVLAAGIQPVISSGNSAFFNGSFRDGVSAPACVPAAITVGATYDQNVGVPLPWGTAPHDCVDAGGAVVDGLPCFSQTAPILSLLAPGAVVTAGGQAWAGTSQAAPQVAGAWAIMRAAAPGATTILEVLQATGDPVVDSRPGVNRTTSRLNLVPEPGFGALLAMGSMGLVGISGRRRRAPTLH